MHPNRSHPSSYPATAPPPGHQRNRIACSNCRRRKIKCITKEKQPRSPCERCAKEGTTCEYVAITNEEDTYGSGNTAPPAPRWVEPLDPESYARSKGGFRPPAPQAPQVPGMYAGYGAQPAGPPGGPMAMGQQPGYFHPSQYPPSSSSAQGNFPGNQFQPGNAPYPGAGAPHVHYGAFPGPAKSIYPWTQPPTQSYNGGCTCTTQQCVCGRRGPQ